MYQSINESEFRSAFHSCGRGEQFSYEGLTILFEGLEQYEQDTGEEIELDVIALCCEYSELSESEIKDAYGYIFNKGEILEEFLNDHTFVLGSHEKDGIKYYVFQQF
jgi:hypothetical protein